MVGMVVTISPSFSLYRMVVLPAAALPRQVSATRRWQPHRETKGKKYHTPTIGTARARFPSTNTHIIVRRRPSTLPDQHPVSSPAKAHAPSGPESPANWPLVTFHTPTRTSSSVRKQRADHFPPRLHPFLKSKASTSPHQGHPKHSAYRPAPPSGSASPSCQTGWQTPWTETSPWWATVWWGPRPRAHTV